MSIKENITKLRASLPPQVRLVAVSKFHPAEELLEAYSAGQRIFGESRAQELTAKQKVLPNDIEWHFIGSLQSNKAKDIASFIHTIHSIDSLKLLQEVNKQAGKHNRIIRVLLELHVAQEESKHGFTPEECRVFLQSFDKAAFPHIRICGLMGMASNTDDESRIQQEFQTLHSLFTSFKKSFFADEDYFCELSMGMSDDYLLAIQEGSTLIRIGTSIFGERKY
jgi:pyridoxal phosphate enzyme (YggS family)